LKYSPTLIFFDKAQILFVAVVLCQKGTAVTVYKSIYSCCAKTPPTGEYLGSQRG